eukprot:3726606-Amphidinium_carterae.1
MLCASIFALHLALIVDNTASPQDLINHCLVQLYVPKNAPASDTKLPRPLQTQAFGNIWHATVNCVEHAGC